VKGPLRKAKAEGEGPEKFMEIAEAAQLGPM